MAKPDTGLYEKYTPWPLQKIFRRWGCLFRVSNDIFKAPLERLSYIRENVSLLGGQFPRECPICGYMGYFGAFGTPARLDALCPSCRSLERHRLLYLYCIERGDLTEKEAILHFAPEAVLSQILRKAVKRYDTADLSGHDVDFPLNIENIDIPDGQYDAVIANHILEHVDDSKALAEVRRVLKTDGVFYCMVPIVEGWERSYENEGVADDAGRELHYGQNDHIRYYGRDFRSRLSRAGFAVQEHTAFGEEAIRYGLLRGEKVFLCRKANGGTSAR